MQEAVMFNRSHNFPGGRHGPQFGRGDLKYVILDLISEKPRHGYDIIRALEEYSHGFYVPSPGVVYPTLQMLEEMGHATVEQRDGKKVYTITEAGSRFLDERAGPAGVIKDMMKGRWGGGNAIAVGRTIHRFRRLGWTLGRRASSLSKEQVKSVGEVLAETQRQIEAILAERGDDDKGENNDR
jgi:DNA-binding PadR family transcriptional regulator